MTDVVPGGKRRIDRVLDAGYLSGLSDRSTAGVRSRRDEALAELADLNRVGHQLDERIAMVTAEQRRRAAANFGTGTTLPVGSGQPDARPEASPDEPSTGARLARVFRLRADPDSPPTHRRRRRVERLVADVDLADVTSRTDDELARVLRTFRYERRQVTEISARVRAVVERCGDELGRRRVSRDSAAPDHPPGKALSGP